MKRQQYQRILSATLLAALGAASFGATSVFADGYYEGMNYSTALSTAHQLGSDDTVIQDPSIVSGLTPLISSGMDAVQTGFSDTNLWKQGFINDTIDGERVCREINYFEVSSASPINENSGLSFSVEDNGSGYRAGVQIVGAAVQNPDGTASNVKSMIGIVTDFGWVYGGWTVYGNETDCQAQTGAVIDKINLGETHVFVNMRVKTYRGNSSTPLISNKLYLGITDIDAAQSYKILNADNMLSPSNMYAQDLSKLQPGSDSATPDLHNYYVADGNYIFSQYNAAAEAGHRTIATPNESNIFVPLTENTQRDGLELVFGFGDNAASGLSYYSKLYTVKYVSDDYGSIIGKSQESVISGENPTGSIQEPATNYALSHWEADVDVVLEDGTTEIKAGNPITEEQITQVDVNEDITFKAYHVKQFTVTYKSDENGSITGITSEDVKENDNPAGTDQASKTGYTLTYWVADVDVILEDGTRIKKGDPITTAQLNQVVVTEDVTFTAIHIPKVATPDTGTITKGIDTAQIVTLSVFGITACGLAIKYLPRALRKKVNFKK